MKGGGGAWYDGNSSWEVRYGEMGARISMRAASLAGPLGCLPACLSAALPRCRASCLLASRRFHAAAGWWAASHICGAPPSVLMVLLLLVLSPFPLFNLFPASLLPPTLLLARGCYISSLLTATTCSHLRPRDTHLPPPAATSPPLLQTSCLLSCARTAQGCWWTQMPLPPRPGGPPGSPSPPAQAQRPWRRAGQAPPAGPPPNSCWSASSVGGAPPCLPPTLRTMRWLCWAQARGGSKGGGMLRRPV